MNRKPLQPDNEGHYGAETFELDKSSHLRFSPGKHPADNVAAAMVREESRRRFFARGAQGIGALALASTLGEQAYADPGPAPAKTTGGLPSLPHFAPKAKRCIYLHLVGAP